MCKEYKLVMTCLVGLNPAQTPEGLEVSPAERLYIVFTLSTSQPANASLVCVWGGCGTVAESSKTISRTISLTRAINKQKCCCKVLLLVENTAWPKNQRLKHQWDIFKTKTICEIWFGWWLKAAWPSRSAPQPRMTKFEGKQEFFSQLVWSDLCQSWVGCPDVEIHYCGCDVQFNSHPVSNKDQH